jgi:hypothetical protein
MFLQGYLDYWETLLYLSEQGRSIGEFLPGTARPGFAPT